MVGRNTVEKNPSSTSPVPTGATGTHLRSEYGLQHASYSYEMQLKLTCSVMATNDGFEKKKGGKSTVRNRRLSYTIRRNLFAKMVGDEDSKSPE